MEARRQLTDEMLGMVPTLHPETQKAVSRAMDPSYLLPSVVKAPICLARRVQGGRSDRIGAGP
jgi:hypothetical protein